MTTPLAVKSDSQWWHCHDCGTNHDGQPEERTTVEFNFDGSKEEFLALTWEQLANEESSDGVDDIYVTRRFVCPSCGTLDEDDYTQIEVGTTVYRCSGCEEDHHDEDSAHECCA